MNFLSNAFSRLSASSIPYTIKSKIFESSGDTDYIIWTIYDGINPKSDSAVTIFEFNLKNPGVASYANLARNCFRKLKLVKFPQIISIIDFFETDASLYIVTEAVTPLGKYLAANDTQISKEAKDYGLYSILNALVFINSKANCVHGNLNMYSVYVNRQGEWKLFGFEVLTNLNSDPDRPLYKLSQDLPSFEFGSPPEVLNSGVQAVQLSPMLLDSYKLGVFISQLYATKDFSSIPRIGNKDLAQMRSKLPLLLAGPVLKLIGVKRITTQRFLQETKSYFDQSPLVEFTAMLDEIKYAEDLAKILFFKNGLSSYVDHEFPPGYLDNKLIPEIVDQYFVVVRKKATPSSTPEELAVRQEALAIMLNHILTLGENLDTELFNKLIAPVIFQAFTLPDRTIRLSLLKHLASYGPKLLEQDVQAKVFLNLLTGFQDTNFLIRETSLTSLTLIIDKVSVKQINNELLRVLAKLQMDPKPSIRANTLILITKISSFIYSNSRNNVTITALSKGLRDSFTPCKMAALCAFDNLIDSFGLEEKCTKVLGHLAVSLMDPKSHKVRTEAKRVLQKYLDAVEEHAARFPLEEEDDDAEEREFMARVAESTVPAQKSSGQSSSAPIISFGWSMMNKLVSSEPSAVSGKIDPLLNRSTPDFTKHCTPPVTQEWKDEIIDDWNTDEAEISHMVPPLLSKKTVPKRSIGKETPGRSSGLKLGTARKTPGSTINVDLTMEDDADAWGDLW